MSWNQLKAKLAFLFGRRHQFALCPIRARNCGRMLLVVGALLLARSANGSVLATGIYSPADNPFTTSVNEGIPTDGNFVNPFELPGTGGLVYQTYFEGRHSDGTNSTDPADDTNVNFDIFVGTFVPPGGGGATLAGQGSLLISGESALRDQDLIIADLGPVAGQIRPGNGSVRITGFGSLYNNDPNILPAEVQAAIAAGFNFHSVNPRDKNAGFDVIVGRYGTGTLEITAGARAEIQDALVVGDQPGSNGNLVIDGVDSSLSSGGFTGTGGSGGSGGRTTLHAMAVGRQGNGNMMISGGGTVVSEGPATSGSGQGSTTITVAAAIGSAPLIQSGQSIQDAGGTGIATVTGPGSKWTVGGSLQVGGFDIGSTGSVLSQVGDLEGDNVTYLSQYGIGTLNVNAGGVVQIRNPIGTDAASTNPAPLGLLVGHFSRVELSGGTINVGSTLQSTGGGGTGSDNQGIPDAVQVINDGVITGTGRINTGGFRNRYLGEVRVTSGQSLIIDAGAQFQSTAGTTTNDPLVNFGKINLTGTPLGQASLEFVRASTAGQNSAVRPFINSPIPPPTSGTFPPGVFTGGQISAQYANLTFGSGLQNRSMLAFTAGTNNVTGSVVSIATDTTDTESGGDTAEGDGGEISQVLVSGPTTTAVFHDDLAFTGNADLNLSNGGNVVVLNQHSFSLAGNLGIELSYAHPSKIVVGGDVGIGNGTSDLTVNLDSDVLHSLKHGDAFQIISFAGEIGNVNLTNPTNPVPDLTMPPLFTDIETSPNIRALYGLDTVVEFSNEGVYVKFLNPMAVGGGAGAMGPDFNGDGKVDSADFAIWQAHVGITSGASVLEGDANGDGKVDGADFLMWQRNVGKPKPWFGAGAAVPEPASLAMLLCALSMGLAFSRRR